MKDSIQKQKEQDQRDKKTLIPLAWIIGCAIILALLFCLIHNDRIWSN